MRKLKQQKDDNFEKLKREKSCKVRGLKELGKVKKGLKGAEGF